MNEPTKRPNAYIWHLRLAWSLRNTTFFKALADWQQCEAVLDTAPYVLQRLGRQIVLWITGWLLAGVWTGLLGYNAISQWIENQHYDGEIIYFPCTPIELWIILSTPVLLTVVVTLPFGVNVFVRYFNVSSTYTNELLRSLTNRSTTRRFARR